MVAMASPKILLVFRCGHEYVFAHGQTMAMLTVMLSPTTINVFDNAHADDLAKQVAEWALCNDPRRQTVDLTVKGAELSAFYRYYFDNESLAKQACSHVK